MVGKEPWEHPNDMITTLCEYCHKLEHNITTNIGNKKQSKDIRWQKAKLILLEYHNFKWRTILKARLN